VLHSSTFIEPKTKIRTVGHTGDGGGSSDVALQRASSETRLEVRHAVKARRFLEETKRGGERRIGDGGGSPRLLHPKVESPAPPKRWFATYLNRESRERKKRMNAATTKRSSWIG